MKTKLFYMKRMLSVFFLSIMFIFQGCDDYMDIVPDNIAELDQAFSMKSMAEKFLFTCYSWMPRGYNFNENAALLSGDEMWLNSTTNFPQSDWQSWYIARGGQNTNSPLLNYWDGNNGGIQMWRGIRECNIFLENIYNVQDMTEAEKNQWAAEAKFLKAYYHYYLLRMYGPIPIVDENIPTFEDPENISFEREPVDVVFEYIINTIDEAMPDLMETVIQPTTETGRVTQVVAKAMKAEILVTAASPLFNGNTDYNGYNKADGTPLFNSTYIPEKWQIAADACLEAIQVAEEAGKSLYRWVPPSNVITTPQESTINQMSIRQAVTERRDNTESIWVNNRSSATQGQQALGFIPRSIDPQKISNNSTGGYMAPTLNMALEFYTDHGVPINEDINWDYEGRFDLREVPLGDSEYQYDLIPGYTTVGLHFDREDRFYGSLSFDGGRYYMSNHGDDSEAYTINSRPGGNTAATNSPSRYSGTGYTPKKLVSYYNVIGDGGSFTVYAYPFTIMRLGNLYLLYAEAQNEVGGPSEEIFKYLDAIRNRSGLNGVRESWSQFSRFPNKPNSKDGLREIIRQERTIELAFESQRFWDLKRWKTAQEELNTPIYGWDILQSTPQTYYRRVVLFSRTFTLRDYFWPISINELRRNDELLQTPLW